MNRGVEVTAVADCCAFAAEYEDIDKQEEVNRMAAEMMRMMVGHDEEDDEVGVIFDLLRPLRRPRDDAIGIL